MRTSLQTMNCELQHKLCELFFMQPPWIFIWPSISHDLLGVMQVAQHQWLFFTQPLLSYAIRASCMLVAFFSSSLLHTTLNMQIVRLFIFFLVGNWRDSLNRSSNSKLWPCELSKRCNDFQQCYLNERVKWFDKLYCVLAMVQQWRDVSFNKLYCVLAMVQQ